MYDLRLVNPFTMLVAGASSSGKTSLVAQMMNARQQLYSKKAGKVYYFYRVRNDEAFRNMPWVDEFIMGLPTMNWLEQNIDTEENETVVIDDLALEVDMDTARIFTAGSHHLRVNVIFVCQNLFTRNPYFREISTNSNYIVIFKNPRDLSTITNFARQYRPGTSRQVVDIFKRATAHPHTYLFFDLKQSTEDRLRIRSNLFAQHGEPMQLYILAEDNSAI